MITIIGTKNCNFCDLAQKVCQLKEQEYQYYSLNEDKEWTDKFVSKGFKSVPQIWVEDEHIGGYTELCERLTTD